MTRIVKGGGGGANGKRARQEWFVSFQLQFRRAVVSPPSSGDQRGRHKNNARSCRTGVTPATWRFPRNPGLFRTRLHSLWMSVFDSAFILFKNNAKFMKGSPFVYMSAAIMSQPKLTRDLLEHRQALLGFIFALTRDFDASEDIFQETALAILDEAAMGRQVEPFLPWAREVARRRTAEYQRASTRARRAEALPGALLEVLGRSFDESDEAMENVRARQKYLSQCLETLTARMRRMLELRYHGEQDVARIARDAGWTVDAVHVALSRTRKTLAECIARRLNSGGAPSL